MAGLRSSVPFYNAPGTRQIRYLFQLILRRTYKICNIPHPRTCELKRNAPTLSRLPKYFPCLPSTSTSFCCCQTSSSENMLATSDQVFSLPEGKAEPKSFKDFLLENNAFTPEGITNKYNNKLKCNYCDEIIKGSSTLMRHKQSVHREKLQVNAEFVLRRYLKVADKTLTCYHCGKSFKKRKTLISHEKNVHKTQHAVAQSLNLYRVSPYFNDWLGLINTGIQAQQLPESLLAELEKMPLNKPRRRPPRKVRSIFVPKITFGSVNRGRCQFCEIVCSSNHIRRHEWTCHNDKIEVQAQMIYVKLVAEKQTVCRWCSRISPARKTRKLHERKIHGSEPDFATKPDFSLRVKSAEDQLEQLIVAGLVPSDTMQKVRDNAANAQQMRRPKTKLVSTECRFCQKVYTSARVARKHELEEHTDELEVQAQLFLNKFVKSSTAHMGSGKYSFRKCRWCNTSFMNDYLRRLHEINTHSQHFQEPGFIRDSTNDTSSYDSAIQELRNLIVLRFVADNELQEANKRAREVKKQKSMQEKQFKFALEQVHDDSAFTSEPDDSSELSEIEHDAHATMTTPDDGERKQLSWQWTDPEIDDLLLDLLSGQNFKDGRTRLVLLHPSSSSLPLRILSSKKVPRLLLLEKKNEHLAYWKDSAKTRRKLMVENCEAGRIESWLVSMGKSKRGLQRLEKVFGSVDPSIWTEFDTGKNPYPRITLLGMLDPVIDVQRNFLLWYFYTLLSKDNIFSYGPVELITFLLPRQYVLLAPEMPIDEFSTATKFGKFHAEQFRSVLDTQLLKSVSGDDFEPKIPVKPLFRYEKNFLKTGLDKNSLQLVRITPKPETSLRVGGQPISREDFLLFHFFHKQLVHNLVDEPVRKVLMPWFPESPSHLDRLNLSDRSVGSLDSAEVAVLFQEIVRPHVLQSANNEDSFSLEANKFLEEMTGENPGD